MPSIGDDDRVEEAVDPEFEAETDEEIFDVAEEAFCEGLTEIKKAIVDAFVHIYLVNTPFAAQDHSTTLDTNSQTNKANFKIESLFTTLSVLSLFNFCIVYYLHLRTFVVG